MHYSHTKATFQEEQMGITTKEFSPSSLFSPTAVSHRYQHLQKKLWKDSLNKKARYEIETESLFKNNKTKRTLTELIPSPLFLSYSNISSISTFMHNMKRFLKLFSKTKSRNQKCLLKNTTLTILFSEKKTKSYYS